MRFCLKFQINTLFHSYIYFVSFLQIHFHRNRGQLILYRKKSLAKLVRGFQLLRFLYVKDYLLFVFDFRDEVSDIILHRLIYLYPISLCSLPGKMLTATRNRVTIVGGDCVLNI